MALLALKIDVATYRGTIEGVPRLVDILQRHGAEATFLFSLGRDHTGRAIRRILRSHQTARYGLKALCYGTLLPGPDIGRRCADKLRSVRDAGHEVGVHGWDHAKWQADAAEADMAWTEQEMQLACNQFANIFNDAPRVHGAADWQMNRHALRLTQRLGFRYASDCRGIHPFMPVWNAEVVHCPQLPTTLPTLDEMIGGVVTEANVHEHLLAMTQDIPATGHVYTLRAELEGMQFADSFERLLVGWKDQGYELASLRQLHASLTEDELPRHELFVGEIPGRASPLLLQGQAFLHDAAA